MRDSFNLLDAHFMVKAPVNMTDDKAQELIDDLSESLSMSLNAVMTSIREKFGNRIADISFRMED